VDAFTPANDLERDLIAAQEGRLEVFHLMSRLWAAEVHVPTAHEITEQKQFAPLVVEREGNSYVVVCTSLERARTIEGVKSIVGTHVKNLVQSMPQAFGIVINPGWQVGLELPAHGVEQLRSTFQ
jgi:hypothetical protein